MQFQVVLTQKKQLIRY